MEVTNLIVFLGTIFTLTILMVTAIIIMASQKRQSQLKSQFHQLEVEKQKELLEAILVSQEKERQKIGLELHDELGPTFAAIRMNVDRVQKKIEKEDYAGVTGILSQTSGYLKEVIGQFSDLSRLLYPVILNKHGIHIALEETISRANETTGISFKLVLDFNTIHKDVTEHSIYRIVQELTTNALKHSKATEVLFEVKQIGKFISICYTDDGVGFDPSFPNIGLGLNSITGRVQSISGRVNVETTPTKGLKIEILLPND